jgi:hypothetical protein
MPTIANVPPSDESIGSCKFLNLTTASAPNFLTLEAGGKRVCRAIRANEAGTLTVKSESDDDVIVPFLAGEMLPIRCKSVTGAAGIINILVFW